MKCKICGFEGKALATHIKWKHDMLPSEYKIEYNVRSLSDVTPEQRQQQSDYWKVRANTPEWKAQLKQNNSSQWTTKYWIKKGMCLDEAINKVSELQRLNSAKSTDVSIEEQRHRSCRCIEHWIDKGYSDEDAFNKVHVLQSEISVKSSKFTGHKHSDKSKLKTANKMRLHIETVGASNWTLHYHTGCRSKGEASLFDYVVNEMKLDASANEDIGHYNVDILYGMKIIEYFGNYWHCYPLFFENGDMIHPTFGTKISDTWNTDALKISTLESLGYDVMIVWEYDYTTTPDQVKSNIKAFLQ